MFMGRFRFHILGGLLCLLATGSFAQSADTARTADSVRTIHATETVPVQPALPIGVYTDAFWMLWFNTSLEGKGVYFNLGLEIPVTRKSDINVEISYIAPAGIFFSMTGSYVVYSLENRTGISQKFDLGYLVFGSDSEDCSENEYFSSCTSTFSVPLLKAMYNVRYSLKSGPFFLTPEAGAGLVGSSQGFIPWFMGGVRVSYRSMD